MYLKQICALWLSGWPRNYSGPARGGIAAETIPGSWRPPAWERVSYHSRLRPTPQHCAVEGCDRALNLSPADGLLHGGCVLKPDDGRRQHGHINCLASVVTGIDDGIAAV